MKKQISLFLLSLLLSIGSPNCLFAKDYLANRIHPGDKRESTFRLCFKILEHRGAKTLVETGTARCGVKNCYGDGCSTVLLADWAKDHNATLFSVDIDAAAIKESQAAVRAINPHVQFATQDSISFLEQFDRQIDFLYLDSYDFEVSNPYPSQFHHLKELKAALPHLHKDTVIMIDDCDLPYGGKGKLAIEFLTAHGWEVLISGYQVILICPESN